MIREAYACLMLNIIREFKIVVYTTFGKCRMGSDVTCLDVNMTRMEEINQYVTLLGVDQILEVNHV